VAKLELFPFQKESVEQLEKWNGRALLALEMGLGKSAVSIHWTAKHPKRKPVVIICPASLKLNWKRELYKWTKNPKVVILEGLKPSSLKSYSDHYIIINYDIVFGWLPALLKVKPQVVILDECQYLKNRNAKRSRATISLAVRTPHIIAISGTPIINRPIEFYNILALLRPSMFNSWWGYAKRYCQAKRTRWGLDTSGASNLDELNLKITRTCTIRKLKSEVQKELPDKLRTVIPLSINNIREYKEALNENDLNPLQYFSNLKRVATRGKMDLVIDWIANVIENNKLIAFCHHHEIVDLLMEKFKKVAVRLTGKEDLKQRQKAIDDFQNNPKIKLFVGNMQAAGVGINLTASNHVAFVELGWTPSDHEQCEDRAHRIGQKNAVNIYYLIADKTVEEDILTLIDRKREVITKIMDGKKPEDTEILKELMKLYKQRRDK